jgi:phenylalanyl-tRNA synthetase alpha chain
MSTSHPALSAEAVRRALCVRDLTDPESGPHAMQLLVQLLLDALRAAWHAEIWLRRASPIVSVADNYDALRYPPDGVARDARYTRYVCDVAVLRTQTSALIPPALKDLARRGERPDVLIACPGIVYRRDCIDRHHSGEPHQLDLWRIRRGDALGAADLREMIAEVVDAVLPGWEHRVLPAIHPYTLDGLQIDVAGPDGWLEIGECGLAHPELLAAAGLDPATTSGLAMGLGLDRLMMLKKGVDDIRLLRSDNPRVAAQMLDLSAYRPVSCMPPVRRDLSIVVGADANGEELGDRVRSALGARANAVESVEVVAETAWGELPPAARRRLALAPSQKNVLLRVVLRDLERTLTHTEANELRDAIYAAVHEGSVKEWAGSARSE